MPTNPTRVFITHLPHIEVDGKLMVHLLGILVTNAMLTVDVTNNPMVHISAQESEQGWVILVEDSGQGSVKQAGTSQTSPTFKETNLKETNLSTAHSQPKATEDEPLAPRDPWDGHFSGATGGTFAAEGRTAHLLGSEEPRLGIATCRRIVERHGGHLWFEDSPLGGTRVCLYLPAHQPDPTQETSTTKANEHPTSELSHP